MTCSVFVNFGLLINERLTEGWTIYVYWLKCNVDKLNYSDANQVIVSHSTFYHLVITETKIVFIKFAHWMYAAA